MNSDTKSDEMEEEGGFAETRTNLIINHLPQNLNEPEFHKMFAVVGPIKNYRIMRDLQSGSSFGFGFVEYTTPVDAAQAILQLNNHGIQNKRLKVSYAQPPDTGDDKETNLYVQNLPKDYAVENLDELFGHYGTINQKLIFKDKATGMPRGVGFVRFETKVQAIAAIEALNGKVPEGGTEALLVKIAKDKTKDGKKMSAYNAGFQAGLMRGRGGRSNYSNRGGAFGRGGYTDMGFVGTTRGFGTSAEVCPPGTGVADFGNQGGKMGIDRTNNRYNPIGSGGGYTTGTGIGLAYMPATGPPPHGPPADATGQSQGQFLRFSAQTNLNPYGGMARTGYATGRY